MGSETAGSAMAAATYPLEVAPKQAKTERESGERAARLLGVQPVPSPVKGCQLALVARQFSDKLRPISLARLGTLLGSRTSSGNRDKA